MLKIVNFSTDKNLIVFFFSISSYANIIIITIAVFPHTERCCKKHSASTERWKWKCTECKKKKNVSV